MTEFEWLTSLDPYPMLRPCRPIIGEHPRKGRLFAAACCYRIWPLLRDRRSRNAVEVATRYSEGLASEPELRVAAEAARAAHAGSFGATGKVGACSEWAAEFAASPDAWLAARSASNFAYLAAEDGLQLQSEREAQSHLLRCIFGPLPFRPVTLDPIWLTSNHGTVVKLAHAIYDEQAFDRLPHLADALEQTRCHDTDILDHCRRPGPHVLGCWVLDLLLGKG